jgi:hypothetical protein
VSRKFGFKVAALAAAAVMAFGSADAMAAKNHAVTAVGKAAGIGSQGTTSLALGRFTGSLGEILVSFRTKVLKNGDLSSTFTAYTRNGTLKGTALQKVTTNSNGGSAFSGTAKIISGTGLYSGAKGTLTATGSQPKDNPVISYKLKGTVRY